MNTKNFPQPRQETINKLVREDFASGYSFDPDRSQRILIKCQGRIFYFSTHDIALDDPDWTHSICINADSAPVQIEEMISATSFPDSGEKWLYACTQFKSQLILLDKGTVPEWCDNMSERYIINRGFSEWADAAPNALPAGLALPE